MDSELCNGGICIGMTNGLHQGANASYPMAFDGTIGTSVHSGTTVPELSRPVDGITYYIWPDIFFGDTSLRRLNH